MDDAQVVREDELVVIASLQLMSWSGAPGERSLKHVAYLVAHPGLLVAPLMLMVADDTVAQPKEEVPHGVLQDSLKFVGI